MFCYLLPFAHSIGLLFSLSLIVWSLVFILFCRSGNHFGRQRQSRIRRRRGHGRLQVALGCCCRRLWQCSCGGLRQQPLAARYAQRRYAQGKSDSFLLTDLPGSIRTLRWSHSHFVYCRHSPFCQVSARVWRVRLAAHVGLASRDHFVLSVCVVSFNINIRPGSFCVINDVCKLDSGVLSPLPCPLGFACNASSLALPALCPAGCVSDFPAFRLPCIV